MAILDWIDFGKVSAERDENLKHYFYDNGILKSLVENRNSFLLLGRKGAGKTALFRHFSENSGDYIQKEDSIISLSLEDYNWKVHELIQTDESAESLAFKQTWRFAILIEVLRTCIERDKRNGNKVAPSMAKAESILEKLFGSPVPGIMELIGRKILKLSKLKLPKGGLDLESGDLDSIEMNAGEVAFEEVNSAKDLRTKLSENVSNILVIIEKALKDCLPFPGRIFICMDRIDDAWDEKSFENSKRVIAGLVSAGDSITQKFGGYVRPIIFLREDIFEVLVINDLNKLREDCGPLLKWDKDSLKTMLLTRINYFAREHNKQEITDLDILFDRTEMKQRAKPYNYLLKRSMMRPRDLICFLNRTLEAMKEEENDPFQETHERFQKLNADSVYAAETGYGEWLKRELIDEWSAQYPLINSILDTIQNIGLANLNVDAWRKEITKAVGDLTPLDQVKILRFMFDNSIIGFQVGGSSTWRFKCFYPSQGFLETNEYRIHEGLVRGLNLKDPRERD